MILNEFVNNSETHGAVEHAKRFDHIRLLSRRTSLISDLNLEQPIFVPELINPSELTLVVGYKNMSECNRLGSNEQIIRADGFAFLFKPSAE